MTIKNYIIGPSRKYQSVIGSTDISQIFNFSPGDKIIKLFFLSLTILENKLERLPLVKFSVCSFVSKAGGYQTSLKRLDRDEHSSLFGFRRQ
jgi:hypothetical protein